MIFSIMGSCIYLKMSFCTKETCGAFGDSAENGHLLSVVRIVCRLRSPKYGCRTSWIECISDNCGLGFHMKT